MGKCIVCNKSAGPFYSLHKACYQVYQDTRGNLRQIFSESIESAMTAEELAGALHDCRPASPFSPHQFKNLIVRTWQEQATQVIKNTSPNDRHANCLLAVASVLAIEDKDVEPYLFQRLANIQHLTRINQGQPALKVFKTVNNEIELESDESVIWVFEDVFKEERQHPAEDKQWNVFRSILNGLFNKSRYKESEVKTEATGALTITNRNLYYATEKETVKICLTDIYAITPMKEGVRIQTTQRNATPDTYITGDGRFTYALLGYAQGQKSTN